MEKNQVWKNQVWRGKPQCNIALTFLLFPVLYRHLVIIEGIWELSGILGGQP